MEAIAKKQLTEEEFYALPAKAKRLALAADVQAHLDVRLIRAEPGRCYADIGTVTIPAGRKTVELQDVLSQRVETCVCCAKGALFLAKVRGYNRFRVSLDFQSSDGEWGPLDSDIKRALDGIFTKRQLDLIENAFERDSRNEIRDNNFQRRDESPGYLAGEMYADVYDPDQRLRLIMQNIIDNDGTFTVPKAER